MLPDTTRSIRPDVDTTCRHGAGNGAAAPILQPRSEEQENAEATTSNATVGGQGAPLRQEEPQRQRVPRLRPRPCRINEAPVQNRLLGIMLHTTRYAFKGESRLATDAGVSKSAVSRLINGHCTPSYPLVAALTLALERQLGQPLDPREVVSLDGSYPTASVCQLCGCKGCLPDAAYDEFDQVRPQYRHLQPGQWVLHPLKSQHSTLEQPLSPMQEDSIPQDNTTATTAYQKAPSPVRLPCRQRFPVRITAIPATAPQDTS
jgi:transcriptional regulator with XRE-family HTH domain